MLLGYPEASAAVERTAGRNILIFGGLTLLQGILWIMMGSSRSAGVAVFGNASCTLNMLAVLMLNLGPQIDRWRVAAREREAEAVMSRTLVCRLSGFLLLWCGISSAVVILPGLVLLFELSSRDLDGFGHFMQAILIFSIVIWAAIQVTFLWRSTRTLILATEGLLLPGSERQMSWRDITQYALRPSGTSLTLLLTLSDDANRQYRPGFRSWFNPLFGLGGNQIMLNLSSYDQSQKTIYDFFKDTWWAAREEA